MKFEEFMASRSKFSRQMGIGEAIRSHKTVLFVILHQEEWDVFFRLSHEEEVRNQLCRFFSLCCYDYEFFLCVLNFCIGRGNYSAGIMTKIGIDFSKLCLFICKWFCFSKKSGRFFLAKFQLHIEFPIFIKGMPNYQNTQMLTQFLKGSVFLNENLLQDMNNTL